LMTFYLVLIGWVLFRATGLESAGDILMQMHGLAGQLPASGSKALIIFALTVAALLFMHLIDYVVLNKTRQWMARWWLFWPLLILIQAICLLIGEPSNAFIYFQF